MSFDVKEGDDALRREGTEMIPFDVKDEERDGKDGIQEKRRRQQHASFNSFQGLGGPQRRLRFDQRDGQHVSMACTS